MAVVGVVAAEAEAAVVVAAAVAPAADTNPLAFLDSNFGWHFLTKTVVPAYLRRIAETYNLP